METHIRKRRYEGYILFGKGHDVVRLPLETLPNKFRRWLISIVFGFVFLDSDGKEIR